MAGKLEMSAFHYRAVNPAGKIISGVMQGDSARQINNQLREKSLTPLAINPAAEPGPSAGYFKRKKRLSPQDLAVVTRQMATLIAAGIPLAEALSSVAEQSNKLVIKAVMLGVRSKVMEGYSLALALAEFPAAFPDLYRTTIAAGEKSAKLSDILIRLAKYSEKQQKIKSKIRQAMIYPVMMLFVCVSVVVFMLTYIVPDIVAVFRQTDQLLPPVTLLLIRLSDILRHDGIYMLIFSGVLWVLIRRFFRYTQVRYRWQSLLLTIPLLGKSIKTVNSARFARTFGILNAAGVPVLEAMRSAAVLIRPLPMRDRVFDSIDKVREGCAIHKALQAGGYFSPLFIQLVAGGESSGQLDAMLEKAAQNQEEEVSALIETLLTLFEPLMILVMGAVVLFIVLAVMLPIFALDNVN